MTDIKERPKASPASRVVMNTVESSNVEAVGYDSETQILAVKFKGERKGVYLYLNVPVSKNEALGAAESVGKFLNQEIKPHHVCTYVDMDYGSGL